MPTKRPIRRLFALSTEEDNILCQEAAKTGETFSSTIRGLMADGFRYRGMVRNVMQRLEREGQLS